jgi:hypothetical protein
MQAGLAERCRPRGSDLRAQGGTHDVTNLALLCGGHHRALHDGLIVIRGAAPDFEVIRVADVPAVERDASPVPHVGDSNADVSTREEVAAQVELALVTLGFSKREARTAIERASARVGLPVDLDTMLRAALRECPK